MSMFIVHVLEGFNILKTNTLKIVLSSYYLTNITCEIGYLLRTVFVTVTNIHKTTGTFFTYRNPVFVTVCVQKRNT